eukprot:1500995-Pyramimonas_sp.AAC.1
MGRSARQGECVPDEAGQKEENRCRREWYPPRLPPDPPLPALSTFPPPLQSASPPTPRGEGGGGRGGRRRIEMTGKRERWRGEKTRT